MLPITIKSEWLGVGGFNFRNASSADLSVRSLKECIGGILLGLFRAFSLCCAQIDAAIAAGDDARVNTLDCSIEPLVDAILGYKAANILEVHTQLEFVGMLIDQYSEDSESVRAYVALLCDLLEKYFGGATPRWRMPPVERLPVAAPLRLRRTSTTATS